MKTDARGDGERQVDIQRRAGPKAYKQTSETDRLAENQSTLNPESDHIGGRRRK